MGASGPYCVAAGRRDHPCSQAARRTATDDHRTVIRDLTDARQRLDAGDWKGSVRASRDAAEVLRGMHAEHLNPKKRSAISMSARPPSLMPNGS